MGEREGSQPIIALQKAVALVVNCTPTLYWQKETFLQPVGES